NVPVLGTGISVDAESAALVNGTFGHALDYDDVLSMMPAHPSAVILAARVCDDPPPPRGVHRGGGAREPGRPPYRRPQFHRGLHRRRGSRRQDRTRHDGRTLPSWLSRDRVARPVLRAGRVVE